MLFVARQAQLLLLSVFVVVVVVVAVLHYKRVGSGNASLSASHWETQLRPIGQVYIYLKVVQFEALVNTGKKKKKNKKKERKKTLVTVFAISICCLHLINLPVSQSCACFFCGSLVVCCCDPVKSKMLFVMWSVK